MSSEPRRYYHESGHGRIDTDGVEWWKCDGIGSEDWFRWEDHTLINLDTYQKKIFWRDRLDHNEYREKPWLAKWRDSE